MNGHAVLLQYGFAFVAVVIFTGEAGLPILIPGELALLLAGNMLVQSPAQLVVAALGLALVDLCATTLLHLAARSGGVRMLHWVLRRLQSHNRKPDEVLTRWRGRLSRHNVVVIFVMRLVPGIRISPSLVAGLLRLPFREFLLGAAPASVIWVGVPLAAGYEVRVHAGAMSAPSLHLVLLIGAACTAILIAAGATWWIRREHGSVSQQSI